MITRPRAVVVDSVGTLITSGIPLPAPWILDVRPDLPAGEDVEAMTVNPESARVGSAELDLVPNLRLLGATSAGMDHLDVDEARRRGITVVNTPDYCTREVADHTIALVMGLLRQTHRLDRRVHGGQWSVSTPAPRAVTGTVLGLWGFGAIGRAVAELARGLGMRVLVHARTDIAADRFDVDQVGWHELWQSSDIVSVHVPRDRSTEGVIDAKTISSMKPNSFVINVSRGGIVDEHALDAALRSGHLAGAAVDVLAQEPPDPSHSLLNAPNLVITPHAAWISEHSVRTPVQRFAAFLQGLDR